MNEILNLIESVSEGFPSYFSTKVLRFCAIILENEFKTSYRKLKRPILREIH